MAKALIILLLFISIACSTSQKAREYPEKIIDQPYTIAKGMNQFFGNYSFGYSKWTLNPDVSYPLPLNLYWEHALSDNFSMVWLIMPLGVKYRFLDKPNIQLGITFFLHLGPPENFYFSPYLLPYLKIRLSEQIALETLLNIQGVTRFKPTGKDVSITLSTGPLLQLHNDIALRPWLSFAYEYGFIATYNSEKLEHKELDNSGRSKVPYGIDLRYSLSRQVTVNLTYSRINFGYGLAQFSYRW